MPVFSVISPFSTAVFVLIATASISALIMAGLVVCTLAGVNHLIGMILGMDLGVVLLVWAYELAGRKLISPKWYKIQKIK